MTEEQKDQQNQAPAAPQPVFLLPGVVSALCGLMVAIHIAASILSVEGQARLTFWLGFIPLRIVAGLQEATDWIPLIWSPFTHAFLHAGWEHLIINVAWLAIFGTLVARRYGPVGTVAIFLIGAAAGAAAFAITNLYSGIYLVGASGGVAALTGAAVRFMFQPVIVGRHPETGEPVALGRKLASFTELFRNPRSRWFTIIWVALNAAVPILPAFTGGADVQVAWQAHLGGFAAGLLLVQLFERRQ